MIICLRPTFIIIWVEETIGTAASPKASNFSLWITHAADVASALGGYDPSQLVHYLHCTKTVSPIFPLSHVPNSTLNE
jgi:hypothetical protein